MYRELMDQPVTAENDYFVPRIKVIGLGGGGSNAVDRMITVGIPGVEYYAANTDLQSLAVCEAPNRIQLGPKGTRGLGAGGKAEVGRIAALESEATLREALSGADIVFVAAGMGGGTGTGSAPVVARIARELGAMAIGVVTFPFSFEGSHRARTAQAGSDALGQQVNTLIKVENDRLLTVAPRNLRLEVAFRVADDVLRQGIQGITELISQAGFINLDFASIEAVIRKGGDALMAIGQGRGKDKVKQAAQAALRYPLLDHDLMERATALLVHVTGGTDLGLMEVNQVMSEVAQAVNPTAEVLFGASEDPEMEGRAQVIMIATGINANAPESIAVESLFGVPMPKEEREQVVEDVSVRSLALDVPAFMRRRALFGAQA